MSGDIAMQRFDAKNLGKFTLRTLRRVVVVIIINVIVAFRVMSFCIFCR